MTIIVVAILTVVMILFLTSVRLGMQAHRAFSLAVCVALIPATCLAYSLLTNSVAVLLSMT